MEGTWDIVEESIILINPDGTTETLSEKTDVGVLTLTEPVFDDGVFLDYTLTLNDGSFSWSLQPFKADEEAKRVFFYYFYCNDLFGCDMIATIESDKRNTQQWSFYRKTGATSGSGTAHRKTTWVLERRD